MPNAGNSREQILAKVREAVEDVAPRSEVYLFGSQARGDAKEQSDWDLLILLDQDSVPFGLETGLMDALYEIELETGEIIAPLIYSKRDWERNHPYTPLYENIEKEGFKVR